MGACPCITANTGAARYSYEVTRRKNCTKFGRIHERAVGQDRGRARRRRSLRVDPNAAWDEQTPRLRARRQRVRRRHVAEPRMYQLVRRRAGAIERAFEIPRSGNPASVRTSSPSARAPDGRDARSIKPSPSACSLSIRNDAGSSGRAVAVGTRAGGRSRALVSRISALSAWLAQHCVSRGALGAPRGMRRSTVVVVLAWVARRRCAIPSAAVACTRATARPPRFA
jgi:hypothetical protein